MEFLPKLRALFPYQRTQRIKLVLDNHTAHKKEEVVALAKKLHIDLWYMPPYCPELNSIEPLRSVIKRDFRARCALKKFENIG